MKHIRSFLARLCMQLVCLLLGIILAVMAGITAYVQFHIHKLQQPEQQLQAAPVFSEIDPANLSGNDQSTVSALTHILLIGQDAREGTEGSRSDSIMICTYNQRTNTLCLTSLLRDLYVPIPGHGSNRINAAYAFGGRDLLQQTVEDCFQLEIDGCVEVDFGQFSEIIDLLGGVRIDLRADEAALISEETGTQLSEGIQSLNGSQALAYARIRKLDADGDFSRTNRQRTVIQAILESYRNAGTGTILKLVYNLLPMISTDMDAGQILALAISAVPQMNQMEFVSRHIPAAGEFQEQTIDGMAVLVPDLEKCRNRLQNSSQ